MDEVTFSRVAPVIGVRDLNRALRRYGLLGFATSPRTRGLPGTATSSGTASSSISASHRSLSVTWVPEIYLYVSDADRLYAAWSASRVKGRFIAPHDTEYGLREFAFMDRERNGAPRRFATFYGVIDRWRRARIWRRAASP